MNASRAKRRWIKWCRYVDKTQSRPSGGAWRKAGCHAGQAKAYGDVMYAQRYYPKGARYPWYPTWGMVSRVR